MPQMNVEAPLDFTNSGNLNYRELGKAWTNEAAATLFIFTPRALSPQFVRPYVYNFNDNLLDELVGKQFNQGIFDGTTRKSDAVLNAIMPTSHEGIYQVRNNELSFYYTFMLIVQKTRNANPLDPFLRAPSPAKRQIISGYFLQEPYSYPGYGQPIINPSATMVFTHDSVFHVTPGDMTRAGHGLINMNHNADNISRTSEQMVAPTPYGPQDNKLYMMRPMDLNRAAELTMNFGDTGVSGLGNASLDSVAGSRGGTAAVPLACALKAPVQQLNHICDAARYCGYNNLFESTHTNSFTNPFIPNMDDPSGMAKHASDMFAASLETVDLGPLTREGSDIDTAIPMTLQRLDEIFGAALVVIPYQVEQSASVELTDQAEITSHKSVMSSMLASTISSMLPCYNIGGIAFSYYSYQSGQFGLRKNGIWQLQHVEALIPNVANDGIDYNLQASIQMFYSELENNLFPILKNAGGEFELHVEINSFNVSLINLIFLDERGWCSNPNGYWETNNCYNNFTNPLLAGEDIATRNVQALATFKNAAISAFTDGAAIQRSYNQPF